MYYVRGGELVTSALCRGVMALCTRGVVVVVVSCETTSSCHGVNSSPPRPRVDSLPARLVGVGRGSSQASEVTVGMSCNAQQVAAGH